MPAILILGGVGFIGRNLVTYLVENNLADHIRIADKVLPATAYLSQNAKKAFNNPIVEFKQANLVDQAETKYGQSEEVYSEKVFGLSLAVAKEAAKRGVKVFVELSTAQLYEADKKPSNEEAKQKPWTLIAKAKQKAEVELRKIPNLNLIILRPAIVYGKSDQLGITPRLIVGAVYKQLKEEMKLLWTKDLKINTVHVNDVVRAIWHVTATKEEKGGRVDPIKEPIVYNLADKGDTDQGKVNEFIQQLFQIDTGFQGTVLSQFAKLNLEAITEDVNDKHLAPWADLCKIGGVLNTPLTPYLDKELLKDNALSVDGSKIEKTGFVYTVPKMTLEWLKEVVVDYQELNLWPK